MKTIQPDTQAGRLLRVLADGRWHGGPDEFGNDFHTARNRINAELAEAGFATQSRRREGKPWYEYRLIGPETIQRAVDQLIEWRFGAAGVALRRQADLILVTVGTIGATDGS